MVLTRAKLISIRNGKWNYVESAGDVFANILTRVPVKNLLVSKAVSKQWHRVIRSSNFIDLQLSRSRENPVYIAYPLMDEVTDVYLVSKDGEKIDNATLPDFEHKSDLRIICSFNGLICCINYPVIEVSDKSVVDEDDLEINICNPATREVLLLPKGSPSIDLPVIGVGFVPGIYEYNIFRFFCPLEIDCFECEIFSSTTGSWRHIGTVAEPPMNCHHVCVKGNVYWFIISEESEGIEKLPGSILSVDMEGNFRKISLPMEVTEHSFLVDFEDCLSLLVVYDDETTMQMWSLEDCVESTWDVKCSVEIPYDTIECAESAAVRGREIILITTEHSFIYNIDSDAWKEIDLAEDFGSTPPFVFTYTESLLPCRGRLDPENGE